MSFTHNVTSVGIKKRIAENLTRNIYFLKVCLTCLASVSSEPEGHIVEDEDDDDEGKAASASSLLEDGLLRLFQGHEESVYACAWSAADPWTFASLSYDGRLVVNQVPRQVKFKILNLI